MSLAIWHNPRCSKSRQTLDLLREKGAEPEVRLYLKDAPDAAEIGAALAALGLTDPRALMRKGEALYRELDLASETDPKRLIAAMAENPVLIERPVVFNGSRAAIGRPPETVLSLL